MTRGTWLVGGLLICVSFLVSDVYASDQAASAVFSLDGDGWLLAADPQNIGRDQKWFESPRPEAKPSRVPWIIQETLPAYHGVAWYWRDFDAPRNPHPRGRYLLRFWQVDYMAEVWLNGAAVGGHEGGEGPFVLDVTDQIRPGAKNRLAVRVLNPIDSPIDGICLRETAHCAKVIPLSAGAAPNSGGIMDSVELVCTAAVYVDDLFVIARPEGNNGTIHIQAGVCNATSATQKGQIDISVASARSGETTTAAHLERDLPAGGSPVECDLAIANPRLWELSDPYLYRVTVRVRIEGTEGFDERSVRCGFRDFRFSNGYFRLNGKRIYLRGTHTGNGYPIGQFLPQDPSLLQRDLLNLKAMGFNAVRFIFRSAIRANLDLCDEIGMLVYTESYASPWIEPSARMTQRFDTAISELIRRDRNHPSIVMWGLMNESPNAPAFQHAITMLPLVRSLDNSRIVMLNSGRYDGTGAAVGSISNPGSAVWEDIISDQHRYLRVPHTADLVQLLRQLSGPNGQNVFLSEYGIGSAVDLWRTVRHYEQRGAVDLEDGQFYRDRLRQFLADWQRWHMNDAFPRPEDFFMASLKKMAGQRTLGLNAIRANPNIVGHNLTSASDQGMCGEGLTTPFRELKPGTIDAVFDAWAPLRWCLFAEPVHIRRHGKVHLEAVLANEDVLKPGEYPALLQVIGPDMKHVMDRQIEVKIPPRDGDREQPFAQLCFAEDLVVHGPAGKYCFTATFEHGAAAAGGVVDFYVTDPAEMPTVESEVVLWGDDPEPAKWLAEVGLRTRSFSAAMSATREVILALSKPPAPGGATVFAELARHIATGSTVVFLSPEIFANGDQPTAWLPLAAKGAIGPITPPWGGLYLKDEWAKRHPIFDGLPCGGLMDYTYYREILPDLVWQGQDPPAEAVAGAIKASQDYASGMMVSVFNLGAGRFVLNTLRIRENLSSHPAAEHLLRNMLRFAASEIDKPPAQLPPDFETQLKAIGYD